MVTISWLWLPILLSAVGVWLMSFLVWVVLPHHKSDYKALPDEEAARKALTPQNLEPGLYNIPHVTSWDDLKQPEVVKKFEEGPSAFITVVPKGVPTMGKKMVLSFVQNLTVAVLVAYMAGRTLSAGSEYLGGVPSGRYYSLAGLWRSLCFGCNLVRPNLGRDRQIPV